MAKNTDDRPQDEKDAEYIEDRLILSNEWVTGKELSYCTQKLDSHRRIRGIAYLIKMGRIQFETLRPASGKGPHVKRYRIDASEVTDDIGLDAEEEMRLQAFKKRYDGDTSKSLDAILQHKEHIAATPIVYEDVKPPEAEPCRICGRVNVGQTNPNPDIFCDVCKVPFTEEEHRALILKAMQDL